MPLGGGDQGVRRAMGVARAEMLSSTHKHHAVLCGSSQLSDAWGGEVRTSPRTRSQESWSLGMQSAGHTMQWPPRWERAWHCGGFAVWPLGASVKGKALPFAGKLGRR